MQKYTLDPSMISLEELYNLTLNKKLIPGRIMLHELMEERFTALKRTGIRDMGALIKSIKTKEAVSNLSAMTGIPVNYLIVLKREAGSYLARPFPLSDIPGVPYEYCEVLKTVGIRHTRDFFERVQRGEDQVKISKRTGIPLARLKEILALADLSRITGVGGVFARVVYDAGITSVAAFAQADAASHYQAFISVIEKHGYASGHFSEADIEYCIEYAKVICKIDSL